MGAVPGTVPGVVRTVVLGGIWGANQIAKSTASRVVVCGLSIEVSRKSTCRAIGEVFAEGTWPASCRVSRGLTCGPVSDVVCAVTSSVICGWQDRGQSQ